MSFEENPCSAPEAEIEKPEDMQTGERWWIWWLTVFASNMALPAFFASLFLNRNGWYGVVLAVVGLWVLGGLGCARSLAFREAIFLGGVLVGFAQVVPMLQFFTGSVGLFVAGWLLGIDQPDDFLGWGPFPQDAGRAVVAGFIMTATTGGLLIGAALFLGTVCLAVRGGETGGG